MRVSEKDVLAMATIEELRQLRVEDIGRRVMAPAEFTHILKLCGGYWQHSGVRQSPHAELTSGKCSDGFVNVLGALRYTNICTIFAQQLTDRIENMLFTKSSDPGIDWVIGSDHAGADLSHEVARINNAQHDFTEKGSEKTQVWKRFTIEPGERVLQVEELITTSGTTVAVQNGIIDGTPHPVTFVPAVGVVVNRSPLREIAGRPVVALANYDIKTWEPSDCPLCNQGSKRLKPKANWAELTRHG